MARFGLQFYLGLILFAVVITKCHAQEEAPKEQNDVPPAPENANGSDWIYMTAPDESTIPKNKEARHAGDHPGAVSGANSQAGGAGASGMAFAAAGTNSQLPIIQKNCGIIPPNEDPNASEYPWMVAILSWDDEFIASGIQLTDSLILTNAHAIIDYSREKRPLKAIIGGINFPRRDERNTFYIAAAAIHPNYGPFAPENDIAILRTFDNINIEFSTICISTLEADYQNTQASCKLLGWNNLENKPANQMEWIYSRLTNQDIKLSTCPTYPCFETVDGPCIGNIGSAIVCTDNAGDGKYFIWGFSPNERSCNAEPPAASTFPVVSTFSNLAFISKYFSTPNPFVSH